MTRTGTPAARSAKNYASSSPITRASGKKKGVAARFIRTGRLIDALMSRAFAALTASPGGYPLDPNRRATHRTTAIS
jgi:hypothetical protein